MEDKIEIRFATKKDKDSIIEFIKMHWAEQHIFVRNSEIFDYQHIYDDNDKISYVLATDKNNKLYGVCGYIPYNKEGTDICQALWKVIKTNDNMLGIKMLNYLKEKLSPRILCCNGINKKIIPIHKFLGNHVEKLKHYYRLSYKEKYSIANIVDRTILPIKESKYKLKLIQSIEELKLKFNIDQYKQRKPYKDQWYLEYRYYNHPVYDYKIFGIEKENGKVESIIIGRELIVDKTKIFRIVDFIGKDGDLQFISEEIQKLIDINKYEYIDCYCYGIDDKIMESAGFKLKDKEDNNIIPNYFQPYEQRNVDIIFFTNDIENFYMFKADGDQDRPNILTVNK